MIVGRDIKPSLEDLVLAHHGVKGMKWGVRKNKPTSSEIHDARQRQAFRAAELNRSIGKLNVSVGTKGEKAAVQDFKKKQIDFLTNEDRVTAAHMTRGEKAAWALLTGPLALGAIGVNKLEVRAAKKNTDEARAAASKAK